MPSKSERHRNGTKRTNDPERTAYLQSRVRPEQHDAVARAAKVADKPIADLVALATMEFATLIMRIKELNPTLTPQQLYTKAHARMVSTHDI